MARRSKTSPIEDFVSVVALLPWWACIGMAVLGYLILSAMAKPVVVTGIQPGQLAPAMTHALIQGLATVGQFVVPIGAPGGQTGRQRRQHVLGLHRVPGVPGNAAVGPAGARNEHRDSSWLITSLQVLPAGPVKSLLLAFAVASLLS